MFDHLVNLGLDGVHIPENIKVSSDSISVTSGSFTLGLHHRGYGEFPGGERAVLFDHGTVISDFHVSHPELLLLPNKGRVEASFIVRDLEAEFASLAGSAPGLSWHIENPLMSDKAVFAPTSPSAEQQPAEQAAAKSDEASDLQDVYPIPGEDAVEPVAAQEAAAESGPSAEQQPAEQAAAKSDEASDLQDVYPIPGEDAVEPVAAQEAAAESDEALELSSSGDGTEVTATSALSSAWAWLGSVVRELGGGKSE